MTGEIFEGIYNKNFLIKKANARDVLNSYFDGIKTIKKLRSLLVKKIEYRKLLVIIKGPYKKDLSELLELIENWLIFLYMYITSI